MNSFVHEWAFCPWLILSWARRLFVCLADILTVADDVPSFWDFGEFVPKWRFKMLRDCNFD